MVIFLGGQWGRNYQGETCQGTSKSMTCDINLDATMSAVSLFKNGNKTPPAFQCRPKLSDEDFSGYWDSKTNEVTISPYSNREGRTDLSGCCFWGRGVMMTRNACNFGRINHYLGVRALSMGYLNFYDVDFCIYPEVVCSSPYSQDLRWAIGFFEWIDRVQTFDLTRSYMEELENLIQNRLNETETNKFIDIVGWALPISCTAGNFQCDPNVDLKLVEERKNNFITLIDVLQLDDLLEEEITTTTTTEATAAFVTTNWVNTDDTGVNRTNITQREYWYPVNEYENGFCVDFSPVPPDVPTYESELVCCIKYFSDQVNGGCLNQMNQNSPPMNSNPIELLPRNPSRRPTPQPDPPSRNPTYEPTYEPTDSLIMMIPISASQIRSMFVAGLHILSSLFLIYFS